MKVIVASGNPVKQQACKKAFEMIFPEKEIEIIGKAISSGVSDQPMSDRETLVGAENRAKKSVLSGEADFYIGIEGGIERSNNHTHSFAWIVIFDGKKMGKSRTTTFLLPQKVVDLIDQGYELGDANDIVFKKHNSKQNNGAVGLLTNNLVTRTSLYKQAVVLAMIPFL